MKMSPEDLQLLKKAAEKKWPDAVMTNSGVVLGLAKIAGQGGVRETEIAGLLPGSPGLGNYCG